MLEAAKLHMARGWHLFPVKGKQPATTHGLLDAANDERRAAIWWERHPDRGIALATGRASGVWVLDLDGEEGKQAFRDLQEKEGDLPFTVSARTKRGFHVYFRMPEAVDVKNSASKIAPGIDVRGTGGYVVIPPSPHPDGGTYDWLPGRSPDETQVRDAPDWLLELVVQKQRKDVAPAGPAPDQIIEGGRNQTLASLAGTMRRRGMTEASILVALEAENEAKCRPPLDGDEVRKIAASVARYEPTAPPKIHPQRNGHHPEPEPSDDSDAAEPTEPSGQELALVTIDVLDRIAQEKMQPIDAVSTPWASWNRASLGAGGGVGLARSWHVIVGASSGAGKSLVAANMAAHAVRTGVDVCLFSLEMSLLENVTRVLSILSGQPISQLEHGRHFDLDRWNQAAERLVEQPGTLRTNDRPIHTLEQIRDSMRHHADAGCRLMIVDYLQLAWVGSADTLYQQITEVSHTIHGIAKDLKVTTVGLSQVNRRTSSGHDKLEKEGLMGGSSLENDAEQVLLLGKSERKYDHYEQDVKLAKNRHGPPTEWKMRMDPRTLQMHEMEP